VPAGATDPAAAMVAVFRKFLRAVKGSSRKGFAHMDAGETEDSWGHPTDAV
jgi:hypothetical protein